MKIMNLDNKREHRPILGVYENQKKKHLKSVNRLLSLVFGDSVDPSRLPVLKTADPNVNEREPDSAGFPLF
jgi:hypothetical protein